MNFRSNISERKKKNTLELAIHYLVPIVVVVAWAPSYIEASAWYSVINYRVLAVVFYVAWTLACSERIIFSLTRNILFAKNFLPPRKVYCHHEI